MGAPVVVDHIVVAATTDKLIARDAPTGAELWRATLPEAPRGGPVVDGHHLRLPFAAQHKLFYLADGGLVKSAAPPPKASRWSEVDGIGRPVTPFVTMQGRVYVANAAGAVLCLAAEQP